MKIQWLGHSAFKLIESTGTSIVTDPFGGDIGYDMAHVSCDAVTCSHDHPSHNAITSVAGSPTVIKGLGAFDVKGVHIEGFGSNHDNDGGNIRGKNTIFTFHLDGVNICHLGDIGEPCSPDLVSLLLPIDILLIPIGGTSTIDSDLAKDYVDKLMPGVVIPMHYKSKHCVLDLDKVDKFFHLFDEDSIVECTSSTLEFERDDFDNYATTTIYLPKRLKKA